MEKQLKKEMWKNRIFQIAPLFGLILLFAGFFAMAVYKDINIPYSMKNILNQSVIVIVVATGAIFIYTLGSFDISLGANMCVSALIGAMAYNKTGSLLVMLAACILTAVGIALVCSILASVFHLPVFVTTIAMLSLLNAAVLMLIGANGTGDIIQVPSQAVSALNTVWFKFVVMALYLAVCIFVFSFLKLGRQEKFTGGNPECARLTGLNPSKLAILAFIMAGIGVGLGSFLTITYAPTLSRNTATSVGMDVIISIVFGGMPVSGGARSKIYSAVVGALSMTLLSQIMLMLNLNSGISQMVKAIIFLLVVYISMSDQRRNMLPR